jgi:hypothetical protein
MLKIYQCQLGDARRGYLTVSFISSEEKDEFSNNVEFAEWLTEYIKGLAEFRLDYVRAVAEDPIETAFLLKNEMEADGYTVDLQLQMPKVELVDLDVEED